MLGMFVGAVLVVGAAPPTDAPTEAPTEASVAWDAPAPPDCPSAAAVQRRIEDLLGRALVEGEVRVEGQVRLIEDRFVLRLRVRSGEVVDERELTAARCEALGETAALVAAVMIDPQVAQNMLDSPPEVPEVVETEAEPEPEPEPEPDELTKSDEDPQEPKPEAPPESEVETERAAASSSSPGLPSTSRSPVRPRGLWLRARVGGEFGAIPGGTGGFSLAVAFGVARVRGELAGAYWIGRPTTSPDVAARIHLGQVTVRACGVLLPRPLAAVVCGGLETGAMRADATRPVSLTRHQIWLSVQAEVGLRWQLGRRVALWVGAQPFVPLVFPRFELRDEAAPSEPQTIYAPSAAGIRGLAGVEVRAWSTDFAWGR
ncbi:MAG: hypothetical protein AAGF11_23580 [Myxococcota bacterium]